MCPEYLKYCLFILLIPLLADAGEILPGKASMVAVNFFQEMKLLSGNPERTKPVIINHYLLSMSIVNNSTIWVLYNLHNDVALRSIVIFTADYLYGKKFGQKYKSNDNDNRLKNVLPGIIHNLSPPAEQQLYRKQNKKSENS